MKVAEVIALPIGTTVWRKYDRPAQISSVTYCRDHWRITFGWREGCSAGYSNVPLTVEEAANIKMPGDPPWTYSGVPRFVRDPQEQIGCPS